MAWEMQQRLRGSMRPPMESRKAWIWYAWLNARWIGCERSYEAAERNIKLEAVNNVERSMINNSKDINLEKKIYKDADGENEDDDGEGEDDDGEDEDDDGENEDGDDDGKEEDEDDEE